MPVYNAAGTLEKSLGSIAALHCRNMEVIFVDDCSTDGTSERLEAFAAQSGIPCRILRRENNGGVASARNCGLDAAQGDWIAWVDADDTIEPGAFDILAKAPEDVDIIGWDWNLGFQKNARYMRQPDFGSPLGALKCLMGGLARWNLWLFLTRRHLWENVRFIPGANMGEDMMVMMKLFLKSSGVLQIHSAYYDYNAVSSTSLSRQFSPERRSEVSRNVAEAEAAVASSVYSKELGDYIQYLKLYIKLPLIISNERANYDVWYSWFSESNHFAASNKALPFRTRMVQWLASRRCWPGVRAYYVFVYRFIYGIIYR